MAMLACVLAFNAIFLAPELRIGQVPLNDAVFHRAASERLLRSLSANEPFLEPWVSEWSLGYPVWRSYQPLPHLVAAAVLWLTQRFVDPAAAFAALQYVLLVCFPLSVYVGVRLMGLGPLAAGLAAILVSTPAGTGDFARYGLSYGATTWRGSGLYSQLFALHLLVLTLGVVTRALDRGTHRALGAVLLATTALSHIIFGYVAFASVALFAVVGPPGARARRVVRLITIVLPAFFLVAWFALPLLLTAGQVNHSRWEPAYKWDSFGAGVILWELVRGTLLDGRRMPLLSGLVALGAVTAGLSFRQTLPRRLLALAVFWLVLFFGRVTWGHLLLLAGIPADFHLHRLQAAFELAAVLVAAWGVDHALQAAVGYKRRLALVAMIGLCGVLVMLGIDRARYLEEGARWGEANLVRYEQARPDLERALEAVRAILAERPGRVSAGKAATWGKDFKVGDVPVYAFLTRAHFDQVSFLYHAMSLTSDVMVLRDEGDAAHDIVFGVRAVIAPADVPPPPHLKLRGTYGQFRVYEASPEGYFGLVDIGARYTGAASTFYDPSAAWLASPLLRSGIVVALGEDLPDLPAVARWEPFPAPPPAMLTPRGRILEETKDGETYRAHLLLQRACYAFVKITWDPYLIATVDGQPAAVLRVTPGFAAVPVPAGSHVVEVRYAPGPLKPVLLCLGLLLFVVSVVTQRAPVAGRVEEQLVSRLGQWGERLVRPPVPTLVVLLVLALLALHPFFRGQLIDGHDALAYPPRLVEFGRAVQDWQIPPLWAPDLGAGYGQPLFEFAPPLLYAAAYPFYAAGCRLTDALQLALVALYAAGAIAMYRLGRRAAGSRGAAVAGAVAWLFAPYVALDLYVRAAFAEAAAVAVAPVALLGLVAALDRPSAMRVVWGGVAVALVVLAHNGVALLLLPVLGLVIIAQRRWRALAVGSMVLLIALGLAAFFWLPALLERDLVKTHLLLHGHWRQHAVSAAQLLWSPWGYGLSVQGPNDGMSFQIGPVHLLLGAVGLVIACRLGSRTRREALVFAAATAAGAWLATTYSAAVWSRVEFLQYLHYPWRALFLPALFLCLLAVPAFEWLGPRLRWYALAVLVLVNIAHTAPKGFLTFDDEYYAPRSIAQRGVNTTTFEEYEPRWVEKRPPYTADRLVGRSGALEVRTLSLESAHQEFAVRAAAPTVVEAATFYYPGWTISVGGRKVGVEPIAGRGTMIFRVLPGHSNVVLDLLPTPVRRIATLVSLGTVAGLALALAAARIGRRARRRPR